MTDQPLTIEVYSDVVCPWCYVGKRRLEQALEALGRQNDACVVWRPFQLNPTMPKAGMDRRVYLEAKFGSAREVTAIQERLATVGRTVGIDFAFGRMERTPNTFDAHRLICFADREGYQNDVVEELFHGCFTEGMNVGQPETLVTLARRAGLDGDRVRTFLESDDGAEAVRDEEERGRRLGIRGVPYFLVNGKPALSGAQPVETFVAAITHFAA
ncbi:MAG: DsbA family oxidoreductase [Nitrospirales bacterium]|nr:DsbA family oxidoreductase [Nitrospirales bacterium]